MLNLLKPISSSQSSPVYASLFMLPLASTPAKSRSRCWGARAKGLELRGFLRSIFGTGDSLKVVTVTANTGFLRAAKGQVSTLCYYYSVDKIPAFSHGQIDLGQKRVRSSHKFVWSTQTRTVLSETCTLYSLLKLVQSSQRSGEDFKH